MASGPAALDGFKPVKSFRTPLTDMSLSGIAGILDLKALVTNKSRPDDNPSSKAAWHNLTRSRVDLDQNTE